MNRLERLEALAEKATERPWAVRQGEWGAWSYVDTAARDVADRSANAEFIVAAVNALPDLIRAVRAGQALRIDYDLWRRSVQVIGGGRNSAELLEALDVAENSLGDALAPLFAEVEP